ncbi:MAG TPA: ABC transporter substrate-binding protein [Alphaproteobacteria bacterium]
MRLTRLLATGVAMALALSAAPFSVSPARAEVNEVRISKGFGVHYLPMYVIQHEKLVEKHAAAAGLGHVTVQWPTIDGGNVINDAMLAGALDIASLGVPGFLTLWAKAKGNPRLEVVGLSAISLGSMYLNTRNPRINSLRDFTEADKIAMPGIKTSYAAVVLQMMVAKEFGEQNYDKLDPLTVGLPYPEAVTALLSGKTEIDAHVASPPFSFMELDNKNIHRVFNSADVFGPTLVIMAHTTRAFYEKNPKLSAAFIAAATEATQLIAKDKRAAARMYNDLATVRSSEDEILRILNDPDTRFTTTPDGFMLFADFMYRVGTIKQKPAAWTDAFVPELASLPGH